MEMNPHDVDALIGISRVNEKLNRLDDAEKNLKQAIALRPDYWNGYLMLALFYNRQKRPDDAVAQLKRVIELTPDNSRAYSNLGAEYIDDGDPKNFPAAEAALKQSLQITPTYDAYSNLGYLYYVQKRYGEAVQAYNDALALNDKDWRVWANLYVCYRMAERRRPTLNRLASQMRSRRSKKQSR